MIHRWSTMFSKGRIWFHNKTWKLSFWIRSVAFYYGHQEIFINPRRTMICQLIWIYCKNHFKLWKNTEKFEFVWLLQFTCCGDNKNEMTHWKRYFTANWSDKQIRSSSTFKLSADCTVQFKKPESYFQSVGNSSTTKTV